MENFEGLNTADNNFENRESLNWRDLKNSAPDEVRTRLKGLNFEALSIDEQIDVLKKLIEDIKSDNDKRYVYRIISTLLEKLMHLRSSQAQQLKYDSILTEFGMTV